MDEDNLLNDDLYVCNNGTYEEFGNIQEIAVSVDLSNGEDKTAITLFEVNEAYIKVGAMSITIAQSFSEAASALKSLVDKWLFACPNRRVVWLALHHKKKRIRKKNLNRAMKIISKQKNTKRGDI